MSWSRTCTAEGAEALWLGARRAPEQPAPDRWRVLLDPAGHPFCVSTQIPERRPARANCASPPDEVESTPVDLRSVADCRRDCLPRATPDAGIGYQRRGPVGESLQHDVLPWASHRRCLTGGGPGTWPRMTSASRRCAITVTRSQAPTSAAEPVWSSWKCVSTPGPARWA
ncbi:MAG: VOC family protein [Pseudonocardiaceae bacterium]